MTDKNGVGVTFVSHDSESTPLVDGCEPQGCCTRDVNYKGASLFQLANLARVSSHCEIFIKYECHSSILFKVEGNKTFRWWVSRDGNAMNYWGSITWKWRTDLRMRDE